MSLIVYQLGSVFGGARFTAWTGIAILMLLGFGYLLLRRGSSAGTHAKAQVIHSPGGQHGVQEA